MTIPPEAVLKELSELLPDLPGEVQSLLSQIPAGTVTTYGDLARALGDERARSARWLGDYLSNHAHTESCPCHRVVRSNGEIGLSVLGDPLLKAKRLRAEGISVSDTGKVDFTQRWTDFHSSRPLECLRQFQVQLAARVKSSPLQKSPRTLGGIDAAYTSDGHVIAAYVELDADSLEVCSEHGLIRPVSFPYIPGYLTFRELPAMLELCLQIRDHQGLADVIFCDGNGQLHPWRAGIATCLGVALDHPMIGIGKSLLCGRVQPEQISDRSLAVKADDENIAAAVGHENSTKRVYASVGHRITLSEAVQLTEQSQGKRVLPVPIQLADRLSKRLKRPDEKGRFH